MIDASHLLSVGHLHLQKNLKCLCFLPFVSYTLCFLPCVSYLYAPCRWCYSRSGNKENVVKPILANTDPGSTSGSSRDCCCGGADSDTVTLMAMQVFLSTILKEDRDE